jgi:hypothetical protein
MTQETRTATLIDDGVAIEEYEISRSVSRSLRYIVKSFLGSARQVPKDRPL